MKRRLLLLPLLLLAYSAFSQTARPTVVVLDLSYSMSLPAAGAPSRLDLLVDELERSTTGEPDSPWALVTFESANEIRVAVQYPATRAVVLAAARAGRPWGTSPVLEAIDFAAVYAAGISSPGRIILVTDAEDTAAFLGGATASSDIPASLADSGLTLEVIALGGDHPGRTPLPEQWAGLTGGTVVFADGNGQSHVVHSATTVRDDHELSVNEDTPVTPAHNSSSGFLTFLSAWLLVTRWNLVAAAAVGIAVVVLALLRWKRRRDRLQQHNARPPELLLEIRSTVKRFEQSFSRFPVRAGSSSRFDLRLEGIGDIRFKLQLADDGLRFTSGTPLNINGVARRDWILETGNQIRIGKYRVTFKDLITREPLSAPPMDLWRIVVLPALALLAGVLLFVLNPLPFREYGPSARDGAATSTPVTTGDSPVSKGDTPSGTGNTTASLVRPGSLPPVTARWSEVSYFDADYLAIHTHPDDESLDFGVLLARLEAAGLQGAVLLLTDGDSGRDQYPERPTGGIYPEEDLTGDELVSVRVQEARRAMAWLGADAYVRGGLPNFPYNSVTDELTVSQVIERWGGSTTIVGELAELITAFSPEIIISPDAPAGPYEHFEHEATGTLVARALETLRSRAANPVRVHLTSVDPLQTQHYGDLLAVPAWDILPGAGVSARQLQMRALGEHFTQRDASTVGLETRLAVPAEYYAIAEWAPGYVFPEIVGIDPIPGN